MLGDMGSIKELFSPNFRSLVWFFAYFLFVYPAAKSSLYDSFKHIHFPDIVIRVGMFVHMYSGRYLILLARRWAGWKETKSYQLRDYLGLLFLLMLVWHGPFPSIFQNGKRQFSAPEPNWNKVVPLTVRSLFFFSNSSRTVCQPSAFHFHS